MFDFKFSVESNGICKKIFSVTWRALPDATHESANFHICLRAWNALRWAWNFLNLRAKNETFSYWNIIQIMHATRLANGRRALEIRQTTVCDLSMIHQTSGSDPFHFYQHSVTHQYRQKSVAELLSGSVDCFESCLIKINCHMPKCKSKQGSRQWSGRQPYAICQWSIKHQAAIRFISINIQSLISTTKSQSLSYWVVRWTAPRAVWSK